MDFNKLVRDRIPEIIKSNGDVPVTHIANDIEFEKALIAKLHEEVDEFIRKPSVEEMADIVEVLRAILVQNGIDFSLFEEIMSRKREERGGFLQKIILERTENRK